MKELNKFTISALAAMLLLSGSCSTFKNMSSTGQDAVIGGSAGAAVGTGVGALIGGGKGAWIGALVGSALGAGTGAAIGNKMDRQKKELEAQLAEVKSMSDEKDAYIIQMVKDSNNLDAIRLTLGDAVLFKTGSATLSPVAKDALKQVADNLAKNNQTDITVLGYTDNTGSYDLNMKLSQDRADAVRQFLISQGISQQRIKSIGEGWTSPVGDNATAAGRAKNRRVEIYITANSDMINSTK